MRAPKAWSVRAPLGLLAFFLIAALLLLPTYALLVGAALLMPPILAAVTVSDAIRDRRLEFGTFTKVFLALVVAPAALLAFAAPFRALLVGTLSFYPAALDKFHDGHELLYGLLNPLFGTLTPYRLDLWWGATATVGIFTLALMDSVRRSMLISQIRNVSTSRARSVAVGFAELSGRAMPLGKAPMTQPLIRSWIQAEGGLHSHRIEIEPFYLEDETGRILIDARGAKVEADEESATTGLHQVKLRQHVGKDGLPEARLMPGDTIFVIGSVQINDDATTKDEHPIVVKPKRSSLLRLEYYDLFFLGNGNEKAQLAAFEKRIRRGWSGVAMLMGITLWLALNAWTNIRQVEELDLNAVSPAFRALSAPTLMERRITVDGMGSATALDWIRSLAGPIRNKDAIMEALHRHNVAQHAVTFLKQPAADIEHADFRVSNHWLMTLKALPEGEWGYEYISRQREARRETQVHRVRFRRAGSRLYASCDAYFSEYVSKTRPVSARQITFAFRNVATGAILSAQIPAAPGWNRLRDFELIQNLEPGEYRVRVAARWDYGERYYEEQVWMAPEIAISLR